MCYQRGTDHFTDKAGKSTAARLRPLSSEHGVMDKATAPVKPDKDATPADLEDYNSKLRQWERKMDCFERYLSQAFNDALGQCSQMMQDKLEDLT